MSKAICPCCGHELYEYVAYPNRKETMFFMCTSTDCLFACNVADHARLSVAMEYTKCQAELYRDIAVDEDQAKWLWEEGKKAWARVKEVFAA